MCKCVLPPGVSPIAVDKYINISILCTAGKNGVLPNASPESDIRFLTFALKQRILFIGYNICLGDMNFLTSSGYPFKSKERETKTNPARVGKLIPMQITSSEIEPE
jgi:hypothetical protein